MKNIIKSKNINMEYKTGFFSEGTYYEDGSPEQHEFLMAPITEEEQETLVGYIKAIYQSKTK